MFFSIITVTYNSKNFLTEAIQSVLSQDFTDFEYILVDGGSTDGTLEIIKNVADQDSRIRWISELDNGISDAFNKGIRLANGKVVGIINSDDTYAAAALSAVAKAFEADLSVDVVHGDMIRFQGDTKLFRLKPAPVDQRIWHDMPINHPATFVRSDTYKKVGLFDTKLKVAMDYELVLRLYRAGCNFHYIERVLANMRYGGASDERFLAARREVFSVTVAAGYPRWRATGWFVVKACMNITKNLLRKFGLHSLILLHPKFKKHKETS
jgi:glycosyltransferase involved in cell wall biosynthesis